MTENIRICQDLMGTGAAIDNRTIKIEAATSTPYLYADERAFRQILLNILTNACKFSAAESPIEVSVTSDRASGLSVSVRDHGIGMKPGEVDLALQPFAQVDSALSRNYDGTGLGLSISKALMQLHAGTLSIESEPGIGTVVHLQFPAERLRSSADNATLSGAATI